MLNTASGDMNFCHFDKYKRAFPSLQDLIPATTAGILATLTHCIDLMNQREEQWRRRLEREHTARKNAEEKFKHAVRTTPPCRGFCP